MHTLSLDPLVLDWAASQAGESLDTLSEVLAKRPKDREAIRAGNLTPAQVEKLAKIARIPYGYLFLDEPPAALHIGVPDLRQSPNPDPLSEDFFEVLDDARRKQRWFRDYMQSRGVERPNFVGMFSERKPTAERLGRTIAETLGISAADRAESKTPAQYYSRLSKRAEDAGILVLKSGIVKSNTRRGLSAREFRGFALTDPFAPLVFINGKDWLVAWVFTLIHEIAHIFVGVSGVSDLVPSARSTGIEALCNAAAGELLVPRTEFVRAFERRNDLALLAREFRVSRLVIARRALDLDLITQVQYEEQAEQSAKAKPLSGKGGNAYETIPVRNSRRFTRTLVSSVYGGHTLFREAARLLNVKPDTVVGLAGREKPRG